MLKKLIKYDLIWISKILGVYFIIALVLSILTRILSFYTDSFAGNLIYSIARGFAISAYISSLITCVMRIWVRFRNNTYKDEAYLTHTLPISKNIMYNSKIISSFISLFITLILIIICLMIVFLNNDLINELKNIFSNSSYIFIIISLILTFILESLYMTFTGIIGILLGHRYNNKRTGKSILFGILLYFIMQTIILAIIYAIGLLNTNLNDLFVNSIPADIESSLKTLVIIVNIIYAIFLTGMYFVGRKIYLKGINVD